MPSLLFLCQDARQGFQYLLCINILWNQIPWGIREDRRGCGFNNKVEKKKLVETLPADNYSSVNFRREDAQAACWSSQNVVSASSNLIVLLEYLSSHQKQDMGFKRQSLPCVCHQERTASLCLEQPPRDFHKQYVEQSSVWTGSGTVSSVWIGLPCP